MLDISHLASYTSLTMKCEIEEFKSRDDVLGNSAVAATVTVENGARHGWSNTCVVITHDLDEIVVAGQILLVENARRLLLPERAGTGGGGKVDNHH